MKFEWFTYSFLNMYCIFFSIPYRNLQTRNNTRKSFWLDITKLFRSRVIIRSKKDAEVSITLMLLHLCLWNGKSSEIQGWTQKAERITILNEARYQIETSRYFQNFSKFYLDPARVYFTDPIEQFEGEKDNSINKTNDIKYHWVKKHLALGSRVSVSVSNIG